MEIKREIEWDDDHPLNNAETHEKTFRREGVLRSNSF